MPRLPIYDRPPAELNLKFVLLLGSSANDGDRAHAAFDLNRPDGLSQEGQLPLGSLFRPTCCMRQRNRVAELSHALPHVGNCDQDAFYQGRRSDELWRQPRTAYRETGTYVREALSGAAPADLPICGQSSSTIR